MSAYFGCPGPEAFSACLAIAEKGISAPLGVLCVLPNALLGAGTPGDVVTEEPLASRLGDEPNRCMFCSCNPGTDRDGTIAAAGTVAEAPLGVCLEPVACVDVDPADAKPSNEVDPWNCLLPALARRALPIPVA